MDLGASGRHSLFSRLHLRGSDAAALQHWRCLKMCVHAGVSGVPQHPSSDAVSACCFLVDVLLTSLGRCRERLPACCVSWDSQESQSARRPLELRPNGRAGTGELRRLWKNSIRPPSRLLYRVITEPLRGDGNGSAIQADSTEPHVAPSQIQGH